MIIRRPTGIFRDQLPQGPSDPGNVTYTISADEPTRIDLDFTQIPDGVASQRAKPIHSKERRRESLGDLVYTIKTPGLVNVVDGTRIFELGQILEFEDTATGDESVEPMPDDNVELQYNLSRIDFSELDLSPFEIDQINRNAAAAQDRILQEIEELQNRRIFLENDIKDKNKRLAELDKGIKSLETIVANTGDTVVSSALGRLITERESTKNALNQDITEINSLPALIRQRQEQLRSLTKVID